MVREPTTDECKSQGTQMDCWARKSAQGIIHILGDIDVFPKLLMEREPTTDECKSQGTQKNLDSYSIINDLILMEWNPLDGGN